MASVKQQRMAAQIHAIMSDLFLRELNDPRLQQLTITEVRVDREAQGADVYVNALGEDGREDEIVSALQRASGFLRRALGKRTRMRNTPRLHFHWDPIPAHAEQLSQLIESMDIPPEEEEEEE